MSIGVTAQMRARALSPREAELTGRFRPGCGWLPLGCGADDELGVVTRVPWIRAGGGQDGGGWRVLFWGCWRCGAAGVASRTSVPTGCPVLDQGVLRLVSALSWPRGLRWRTCVRPGLQWPLSWRILRRPSGPPRGPFPSFSEAERLADPPKTPKLHEEETRHGKDLQARDARR